MKWPKLKRDYKGLIVKTKIPIENGAIHIAAGTVCEVREWFRGLWLVAPKCEHCGVGIFINRVPQYEVELIGHKDRASELNTTSAMPGAVTGTTPQTAGAASA